MQNSWLNSPAGVGKYILADGHRSKLPLDLWTESVRTGSEQEPPGHSTPDEGLTFINQKFHDLLHLILLSLKFLDEVHPQTLVILSPFGIQLSLESVECVECGQKSCVQIYVARERRLEL